MSGARFASCLCLAGACCAAGAPELGAQSCPIPQVGPAQLGHILFVRQWDEHDRMSATGDGLGPMFNERSCAACHNQGGLGGSGSAEQNVELLCLVPTQSVTRIDRKLFVAQAGMVHPAFVVNDTTALPTIVLHRSSTDPVYAAWRQTLVGMLARGAAMKPKPSFVIRRFERRTPALFGAGLIDSIPPAVLHATAKRQAATAGVRGRVALATDGGVGKFGWRGQTASLEQFVLGACANELGIHVASASQARTPFGNVAAPGDDLNERQCNALVAFVAALPAPVQRKLSSVHEQKAWHAGERLFASLGCAACHPARLGSVAGIYSDLLLHDMGVELSDPAGTNVPGRSGFAQVFDATKYYGGAMDVFVAVPPESQREWRTPPLWGLAVSGPYLHDGRARTLEQAILKHGGEAQAARNKYAALGREDRAKLWAFLYNLGVPAADRSMPQQPGPRVAVR
ncbi:MAG: di-heme oxidoredictase family protein [Pirellulales bacterium]